MKKLQLTKKQMRLFVRPMFSSTIMLGYATKKQVEETLDNMFGKSSRKCKGKSK